MTIPHPLAIEWIVIRGGSGQTIDVHLSSPGWTVLDYSPVHAAIDLLGDDRLLQKGKTLALPRYATATVVILEMQIWGRLNGDGVAHSGGGGIRKNLDFLRANIVRPPANATGKRAATLRLEDGTTKASDVTVLGLNTNERDFGYAKGDIRLKIHGTDAIPGEFV